MDKSVKNSLNMEDMKKVGKSLLIYSIPTYLAFSGVIVPALLSGHIDKQMFLIAIGAGLQSVGASLLNIYNKYRT